MAAGNWVWIAVGVIAIVSILGLAIVVIKRPVDLDDLGAVSKRWMAQNHIDSPDREYQFTRPVVVFASMSSSPVAMAKVDAGAGAIRVGQPVIVQLSVASQSLVTANIDGDCRILIGFDQRRREGRGMILGERRSDAGTARPESHAILAYRHRPVVNEDDLMDLIEGTYAEEIRVPQWAIRDSKVLPDARGLTGTVFTLTVERYDRHPELEGERLLSDSEKSPQPLYRVITCT